MQLIMIGRKIIRPKTWTLIITILLLISSLEHNLNLAGAQQFTGPISMASGDAGAAGLGAPEAILINPAVVTQQSPLDADLFYQDGTVQRNVHKSNMGLLISDNSEGVMFPGALYYFRGSRNYYGQGAEEQLWGMAIARAFNENFSMGFRLTYLTSKIANDREHKQLTPGVGFLYRPTQTLFFGLVLENLTDPDKKIPVAYRLTPETRLGMRYKPAELFSFVLDLSRKEADNPDKKGALHMGLATTSNAFSVFRMGMKWDDYAKQNFFTVGLGFDGPRLKMNYSLHKALKGSNSALHGVDFRVTF